MEVLPSPLLAKGGGVCHPLLVLVGLPSAAGDQSVDVEFEEEIVEYGEISEAQVFPLPLTAVLAGTRDIRHDSASSKEGTSVAAPQILIAPRQWIKNFC